MFLTGHAGFLNFKCILVRCASLSQCHTDCGIWDVYIGFVEKLDLGCCYQASLARHSFVVQSTMFITRYGMCGVEECLNRQKNDDVRGEWWKSSIFELSIPEPPVSGANEVIVGWCEHFWPSYVEKSSMDFHDKASTVLSAMGGRRTSNEE